jgi:hypothetical protein
MGMAVCVVDSFVMIILELLRFVDRLLLLSFGYAYHCGNRRQQRLE